MSLLPYISIVLLLFVSELGHAQEVSDLKPRLIAIFLFTFTIPCIALIQHWWLTRHSNALDSDQACQNVEQMIHWHTSIWFLSSLAMIILFRWDDILRENWNVDRWPIVDEALLIAPFLLSLLASWLIHAKTRQLLHHRAIHTEEPPAEDLESLETKDASGGTSSQIGSSPLQFVIFKLRYVTAILLIPMLLAFLLRDMVTLNWAPEWIGITAVFIAFLLIVYPRLVLVIWPTRKIPDPDFESKVQSLNKKLNLGVEIRLLDTKDQLVSAMVLGLFPGTRALLISDALWNRFSQPELLAIVRHEVAHVTQHHFARRMAWYLIPILAFLGTLELIQLSYADHVNIGLTDCPRLWLGATVIYVGYCWFFVRPKQIEMEFEADKESLEFGDCKDESEQELIRALTRMADYFPDLMDRRSISHPAYRERLEQLFRLSPMKREEPWSPAFKPG